jgi:deazaflavin-dependent oxidoreductase (nitroreductase family)
MTVPRVVRPVMNYLGSPRGTRIDAKAIKYTGHSPYSVLFRLDMRRRGTPPSSPYRPPLALTTIGRRSGRLHIVGLAYYDIDDGWAVVGSAGGSATEPHWVRNVRANPAAFVHLHRRTTPVLAEVLDGAAKQPIWSMITAKVPLFAQFQANVSRDIPIVVLRPRTVRR